MKTVKTSFIGFHDPDALCTIARARIRPYNNYTMEQHPVPQNVTTFQFRLIGDMTIKQFGYLAGGAILAYISYRLPLPFFFTWPAATIFALGGVGFAFVPIEERPMDVWVLSFIKNVYSPTQFVWSREAKTNTSAGQKPIPTSTVAPQVQTHTSTTTAVRAMPDVLRGVFTQPNATPAVRQPTTPPIAPIAVKTRQNPFAWLVQLFSFSKTTKTPKPIVRPAGNYPTPNITGHHIDLSPPPVVTHNQINKGETLKKTQEKENELETKVASLKQELDGKTMTEARVLELQKQLTEVLSEKEKMENELILLRRQVVPPAAVTPVPPPQTGAHVATPQTPKQPTVKIITPEGAVKAGLPRLTTFPNVVTGITKDSDNNFLPGVLVTVKDKGGTPLRALKTNRLGQFAASTPLANGVYFVEVEDPRFRYVFDRVQITLNGSVVPALEIIAKSQKQVSREKLTKEIFGTMN